MTRQKPTAMIDDLPTVQIPLGRKEPGLSIDGDFVHWYELPEEARKLYEKYASQGGNVRIRQCENCGYLTTSKGASNYERQSYTCGGCGDSAGKSWGTNFPQVVGPTIDPDDEQYVDVVALEPDTKCEGGHGPTIKEVEGPTVNGRTITREEVNEEAVECPYCVPNHPSHLGRLKKEAGGSITQSEMLHGVAEAVKAFREA